MRKLDILKPENLNARFQRLAIRGAFGFFPEGMTFGFVKTPFNVSAYTNNIKRFLRASSDWSKAETELFASYVSAQNRCNF